MKMITYQHTGCNESRGAEGNLIVVNGNIKKEDLKILLTLYLMKLGKEEQTKPKARRKEIIKIRADINEIDK